MNLKMKIVFLLFFWTIACCIAKKSIRLVINTNKPIQVIHPLSPSVAMGLGIFQHKLVDHFKDHKFMALARGLGPSYLRVGGTKADLATFEPDEEDYSWKRAYERLGVPPSPNCLSNPRNMTAFEKASLLALAQETEDLILKPITLTGKDWRTLNNFCQCVGWKLIFDLNQWKRNGRSWNSSNARVLIEFTENIFHVNWELGNEPNSYLHKFGKSLSPEQVGEGFVALRALLNTSSWWDSSLIFGPDVNRVTQNSSLDYLNRYLRIAKNVINGVTFHQYYLDGRAANESDFINPHVMDTLAEPLKQVKSVVSSTNLKLWLGETASAAAGGAPGLSNSFIDGFLWLDKLGMAANLGVDMVIRQTFIESHYSLLDSDFNPLPDYWLTLLYKRLVGNRVLSVKVQKCNRFLCGKTHQNYIRVYAHCTNNRNSKYNPGSVVISLINLKSKAIRIFMQPFNGAALKTDMYLLEPGIPGNLTSKTVNLNGRVIQLTSDETIPNLPPRRLSPRSVTKGIRIPARSFGFIVFANANAQACL